MGMYKIDPNKLASQKYRNMYSEVSEEIGVLNTKDGVKKEFITVGNEGDEFLKENIPKKNSLQNTIPTRIEFLFLAFIQTRSKSQGFFKGRQIAEFSKMDRGNIQRVLNKLRSKGYIIFGGSARGSCGFVKYLLTPKGENILKNPLPDFLVEEIEKVRSNKKNKFV